MITMEPTNDADGPDPRHVFLSAADVLDRYGWGKTRGYQNLKDRQQVPPPVVSRPKRWRLDQLMAWEDRKLAMAEAELEAAIKERRVVEIDEQEANPRSIESEPRSVSSPLGTARPRNSENSPCKSRRARESSLARQRLSSNRLATTPSTSLQSSLPSSRSFSIWRRIGFASSKDRSIKKW